MKKLLSVIVATYRRYDVLPRAIDSLLCQKNISRQHLEIIVVDNTPKIYREKVHNASECDTFIYEDISGLSRARNIGVKISNSDLIAFLDDDAIANPNWAHEAVSLMHSNPQWQVIGGRILADYRDTEKPIWINSKLEEFLSCIDWPVSEPMPISKGYWIAGANMIFRRNVFANGLQFDERLGRNGSTSLLSNDETELFEAIGKENIYYVPSMPVQHVIPANRLDPKWFRKRIFWQALSDIIADTHWLTPVEARKKFSEEIINVPAEYRSFRAMEFKPQSADDMDRQLRLIYSMVINMMDGAPCFTWDNLTEEP
jgi:glycosyltransferase involved in cell wall biosynthesis